MIDNYDKLPIGKYQEIRQAIKDDSLDELQLQSTIISILTDKTVDEVLNMPLPEYSECVRKTAFLMTAPVFKAECPKTINLNGVKYNVIRNIDKLTAAQYIDYQTYMKSKDPDDKLADVLSLFIIPEGKTYNEGYDIGEVAQAISDYLPISVGTGICFFFRKKQIESLNYTLTYLGLMMKIWKRKVVTEEQKQLITEAEQMMKKLKDLPIGGVGYTM